MKKMKLDISLNEIADRIALADAVINQSRDHDDISTEQALTLSHYIVSERLQAVANEIEERKAESLDRLTSAAKFMIEDIKTLRDKQNNCSVATIADCLNSITVAIDRMK